MKKNVYIHSITFPIHPVTLPDFMEGIEEHFPDLPVGHWLEISIGRGLVVTQYREETVEEYASRIQAEQDYKAEVKRRADASWERQKRKFARARK